MCHLWFKVRLYDINERMLQRAQNYIENLLEKSVQNGYIDDESYNSAIENIVYDLDIKSAAQDADLVIEAVIEKLDVKIDVFKPDFDSK